MSLLQCYFERAILRVKDKVRAGNLAWSEKEEAQTT
jgi:hypothetical protein